MSAPCRAPANRVRTASLDQAVSVLASAAAYDLRDGSGKVVLPMFWHYRAVSVEIDNETKQFRWPDGTQGRRFRMFVIVVDDERLERAYASEDDFNCLTPECANNCNCPADLRPADPQVCTS